MSRLGLPLLLVALATPASAQSLGRLFYTPEQRQALTQARLRGTVPSADALAGADPGVAPPTAPVAGDAGTSMPTPLPGMTGEMASGIPVVRASPEALLNGVVDRPAGRVAWLDGVAVADGETWRGYRVHVGTRGVRLRRAGEPTRVLGVGQRLDITTGEVRGALAPDAVQRSRR